MEGSKLRLRAIVLTTVTTTFGIFPLMMETSFQAKFLIPMAITLTFGLMFATVLTLVVVPAINMVLADLAAVARWVWNGDEVPDASGEDRPFSPHEPMEPRGLVADGGCRRWGCRSGNREISAGRGPLPSSGAALCS